LKSQEQPGAASVVTRTSTIVPPRLPALVGHWACAATIALSLSYALRRLAAKAHTSRFSIDLKRKSPTASGAVGLEVDGPLSATLGFRAGYRADAHVHAPGKQAHACLSPNRSEAAVSTHVIFLRVVSWFCCGARSLLTPDIEVNGRHGSVQGAGRTLIRDAANGADVVSRVAICSSGDSRDARKKTPSPSDVLAVVIAEFL
jgi:hypothetical protein